jgi:hypothetical protein
VHDFTEQTLRLKQTMDVNFDAIEMPWQSLSSLPESKVGYGEGLKSYFNVLL